MSTDLIVHIALTLGMGFFAFWSKYIHEKIAILEKEKDKDIRNILDDLQMLGLRVDQGSARCSQRSGEIQDGIGKLQERLLRAPEDMRAIFMSKAEVDLLVAESRRDREAIWRAVGRRNGEVNHDRP